MNHFSALMDQVAAELPGERIVGWYLSHPFTVGPYPHTYMSASALRMQQVWQKLEDAHGNPWVHLSVDPLRTLANGAPEMMVFRARGVSGTGAKLPDGSAASEAADRVARWGSEYTKYYALEHTVEMSPSTRSVCAQMQEGHLWSSILTATPMLRAEAQAQLAKRIALVADGLDVGGSGTGANPGAASSATRSGVGSAHPRSADVPKSASAAEKYSEAATDLVAEVWTAQSTQAAKDTLFNASSSTGKMGEGIWPL